MGELTLRKSANGALAIRRDAFGNEEVLKALNNVDKQILHYSTITPIGEMETRILVQKARMAFRYICYDIGFPIPKDSGEWQYIQTRLLDVLKQYYSNLSIYEVKLAFELAATGELDNYLPKDSNGNPDRKHYNHLSVDYFSKILNAYKLKRGEVMGKVFKAMPELPAKADQSQIDILESISREQIKNAFVVYKYTGRLSFELSEEIRCWQWLKRTGYAEDVKETENDRKSAYWNYLKRASAGFIGEAKAYHVRMKGTDAQELDMTAYEMARRTEIKRAFDRMIEDGVNIDELI